MPRPQPLIWVAVNVFRAWCCETPQSEVLALLARAAGLNLAFSTAAPAGQVNQIRMLLQLLQLMRDLGFLDIQDESVQDVFNYVLRISGLQANRSGRTIFVATRLSNQARDVIVRSYRLNQVTVERAQLWSALVQCCEPRTNHYQRECCTCGGSTTPATQTQTSTETRIETQRIEFQDSVPLPRGLQALGDERTITLIGTPSKLILPLVN